jgi:hypothetical protein
MAILLTDLLSVMGYLTLWILGGAITTIFLV